MKKIGFLFLALLLVFAIAGCSAKEPKALSVKDSNQQQEQLQDGAYTLLNGAGSSFVNPLFTKMFSEYKQSDVKVNYQSIGSGGGIKQLIAKTVEFGASDAPMNEDETKSAGGSVLHIPVTLGGVAIAYNLEGVKDLKLTPANLADIYNGKITKWNDPEIVKNNPGAKLPDLAVFPVHRSDGSGTSFIFTTFLNGAAAGKWPKEQVGKSISWANVGTGVKGNEGVAGQVQNTPGAIGYVELAYVIQNNMSAALIQNKANAFVSPTLETVSAAAESAATAMPEDMKISLVNQPGEDSYPIVGTTWVLVYEDSPYDKAKTEKVLKLLQWVVTDGQKYAPELQYAPLPKEIQDLGVEQLKKVKVNGEPVLK